MIFRVGGILSCRNSVLSEPKWCVGNGKSIPVNHSAWFIMKEGVDNGLSFSVHSVGDLIDQDGFCWKTFFIFTILQWQMRFLRLLLSKGNLKNKVI